MSLYYDALGLLVLLPPELLRSILSYITAMNNIVSLINTNPVVAFYTRWSVVEFNSRDYIWFSHIRHFPRLQLLNQPVRIGSVAQLGELSQLPLEIIWAIVPITLFQKNMAELLGQISPGRGFTLIADTSYFHISVHGLRKDEKKRYRDREAGKVFSYFLPPNLEVDPESLGLQMGRHCPDTLLVGRHFSCSQENIFLRRSYRRLLYCAESQSDNIRAAIEANREYLQVIAGETFSEHVINNLRDPPYPSVVKLLAPVSPRGLQTVLQVFPSLQCVHIGLSSRTVVQYLTEEIIRRPSAALFSRLAIARERMEEELDILARIRNLHPRLTEVIIE